eukprot:SAG31_NODE_3189_length_4572_cov_1.854684_2_plen_222_part_00
MLRQVMGCTVSSLEPEERSRRHRREDDELHSISPKRNDRAADSRTDGVSASFLRTVRYAEPDRWRQKKDLDVQEEFRIYQYQSRRFAQRGTEEDDAHLVKQNLAGQTGGSKAFTNKQLRQYATFRRKAIEIEAQQLREERAAGHDPVIEAAIEAAERRAATAAGGKRPNIRALSLRERPLSSPTGQRSPRPHRKSESKSKKRCSKDRGLRSKFAHTLDKYK